MGASASTPAERLSAACKRMLTETEGETGNISKENTAFWLSILGYNNLDTPSDAVRDPQRVSVAAISLQAIIEGFPVDRLREMCQHAKKGKSMKKSEKASQRSRHLKKSNLALLVETCVDAIAQFAEGELRHAGAARSGEEATQKLLNNNDDEGQVEAQGGAEGPEGPGNLSVAVRAANQTAALNSVRILQRVVPVILADARAESVIFWKKTKESSSRHHGGSSSSGKNPTSPEADSSKQVGDGKAEADDAAGATVPAAAVALSTEGHAADTSSSSSHRNARKHNHVSSSRSSTGRAPLARRPPKAPEVLLHAKRGVPEAHRLLDALLALLFIEDFTVAKQPQVGLEQRGWLLPLHYVWSAGVGTTSVVGPTDPRPMMASRVEILRLLTMCLGTALFEPPRSISDVSGGNGSASTSSSGRRDRWIEHLTGTNGYYHLALFFSLLNSGLNYDPVGWGIPYNYMLFADDGEPFADASLHVLLVLLVHSPSGSGDGRGNIFAEFASSLSRHEDYEYLFEAMLRLLRNPAYAGNTWMPASTKEIECHQELLLLLWRLLELNMGFRAFVARQPPILLAQLCDTLLFFVREYYAVPGQSGLVSLCSFLLLLLSSERDFALALNEPFAGSLPRSWPALPIAKGAAKRAGAALAATQSSVDPSTRAAERRRKALAGITSDASGALGDQVRSVQGDGFATYADYLVLVLHRLFTELSHADLAPLLEPLCTILANVSPYIKQLTTHASVALVRLFERYSKRKFLFAGEHNPRIVGYFLEVFNNMLQYQTSSHHRLVYAIVFKKELVENLAAMTFDDPADEDSADQSDPNGWKPSPEWFAAWHDKLALSPLERVIATVVPKLQDAQERQTRAGLTPLSEQQLMAVLQRDSLVGVLPVPHPILIRRYEPNAYTASWFESFLWGLVFRRTVNIPVLSQLSPWIKLFRVLKAPGVEEAKNVAPSNTGAANQPAAPLLETPAPANKPDAPVLKTTSGVGPTTNESSFTAQSSSAQAGAGVVETDDASV